MSKLSVGVNWCRRRAGEHSVIVAIAAASDTRVSLEIIMLQNPAEVEMAKLHQLVVSRNVF